MLWMTSNTVRRGPLGSAAGCYQARVSNSVPLLERVVSTILTGKNSKITAQGEIENANTWAIFELRIL